MKEKTNFRALVLRAAAFLLPMLLILALLSQLFVPKNNSGYAGMEQVSANGILAEPENSIDVVIIGDSETLATFSPMQIWEEQGFTSYVCGTHRQSLMNSCDFLTKALRTQSPKVVILETNAIFRGIYPQQIVFNNVAKRLPVFRYHDRWKSLNPEDFTTSSPQYTKVLQNKGFFIRRKRKPVDDELQESYMSYQTGKVSIRRHARWYLKKIRRMCQENGIRLVLLSTPSPHNWNYKRHNCIQDYADKNDLTYLDMNLHADEIGIDWSRDSMDGGDHLNLTGAKKATSYFASWMKDQEELPDHREDESFQSWNDFLKGYHKSLEKGRDRADYSLTDPMKSIATEIVDAQEK